MGVLYVAGAKPGAGATAVAAGLAAHWKRVGCSLVALKPATLDAGAGSTDAALLASLGGPHTSLDKEPVALPDIDQAVQAIEAAASQADVVVVDGLPLTDGAGGPVAASAELAQRSGARVVGVQPYIAHGETDAGGPTETGARWRAAFGDALSGLIVNRVPVYGRHDAETALAPALAAEGAPALGLIPEDRRMLAPTVRQVANHLDATFFALPSQDTLLVEQFLIGGLLMEWGGNYFGRFDHQGVIVRGGRMDIQMSALNFAMSCMVLTGCAEPPQYVNQRAQAQGVPLMVVAAGTLATAVALESIASRVSVHHPAKVERFVELLVAHADMPALAQAAGAA